MVVDTSCRCELGCQDRYLKQGGGALGALEKQ